VVAEPSATLRLQVACRIAEKAWKAGSTVLIQHPDAQQLAALDEMLWSKSHQQGFIPHEIAATAPDLNGTPVILNTGSGPTAAVDVLINLTAGLPERAELATRIVEIIDGDPVLRAAGRERFKAYRERGCALEKHDL
jgi:DNA polymerase-3 subunit chi